MKVPLPDHQAARIEALRQYEILDTQPMSETLMRELDKWQSLGAHSLEMFPYEDDEL